MSQVKREYVEQIERMDLEHELAITSNAIEL